MRRLPQILAVLAAATQLALATAASAQSAQDLFEQGVQALAASRYEDAMKAFDASYRKEPTANALYNLALCYKVTSHPDKALEAFDSYVKFNDKRKDARTVDSARTEIEQLKNAYARFTLKLSPPEAHIDIDGVEQVSSGGDLWVPIGKRRIAIRADGYESYEQSLEVISGHFDLEVQLRQPSGPPQARAATLVDEGVALQAGGNVEGAIEKYKAAQTAYPTPRALGQLGLAEEMTGDMGGATSHLTDALKSPKDPFIKENKRRMKSALDRAKKRSAELTITGSPEGAEVLVNGKSIGKLPIFGNTRVTAGSLTVTAKKTGYRDYEEIIDLPPRGKRIVRIEMSEATPPPPPVPLPWPPPVPVAAAAPAAVPALTMQAEPFEKPEAKPTDKKPTPTQTDIEAQAEPVVEDLPKSEPSATGFEMALNFGYQPWIGGPKMEGNKGLLAPQLVFGARVLWPLSFGVHLTGGFSTATPGTSVVAAANPTIYVRGHLQQHKRQLGFDAWGGVGIQPLAVQFAVLKAAAVDPSKVDPNTLDPAAIQNQLAKQMVGVDHVHTIQSLNVPFELGASFYFTEGFGIDLATALTLWLPQQDCLHDGSSHLCTNSGLKSQTSLFLGGGLTFLP